MARHQVDRKTLREDRFRDMMFRLIDWAYQRRLWIGAVVAVLVVGAVAAAGTYYYRVSLAKEQARAFYEAERKAGGADTDEAAPGERAGAGYRAFLEQYPGAPQAPIAWMTLARLAWQEGNLEAAGEAFRAVLEHGRASAGQRDLARMGLAKLEENQGNLEASAELYRALSDRPYEELKAYSLGRLASARDRTEEARRQFEKAARGEPGSILAEWAKQNLDYLP